MKNKVINGLERVDKRRAFEVYKTGEPIHIIACKLVPTTVGSLCFSMSCVPSKDNCPKNMRGCAAKFEDRVESFKKYYCNSEVGAYPAYYIKVQKPEYKEKHNDKYTLDKAKWNDYGWDGNIFSLYYGDFKDKDGDEFNVCVEYRKDIDKFAFFMQYADDEIIYIQSNRESKKFFESHISKEYMKYLTEYMRDLMEKEGADVTSYAVTTICYGKKEEWKSRNEAIKFFFEAMQMSEGSERDRYVNIYSELIAGCKICTDGVDDE